MLSDSSEICASPEETFRHGTIIAGTSHAPLILLEGGLGTGKTCWTKGFTAGKGIADLVSSPTYTLMNVYGKNENCVYHFDLYRLSTLEELFDLGFFELIEEGITCVVEWCDRVPEIDYYPHLRVTFDIPLINGKEERNWRQIRWGQHSGKAIEL